METRQQEPSALRAKEGGSKEGKWRGSQMSNAREKDSVRDGNTRYGKKQAEEETGRGKRERRKRKANVKSPQEDKLAQSLSVAAQRPEPAPHPHLQHSTLAALFCGTCRQEKPLQKHNLRLAVALFLLCDGHNLTKPHLCDSEQAAPHGTGAYKNS